MAVDPTQQLSDLSYACWSAKQGAPASIYAMTQSTDGFLWLGTQTGLYSFDGTQFQLYKAADGTYPIIDTVSTLFTNSDEVWVGTRFGVVYLLRKGALTRFDEKSGLPEHSIYQFARTRDGVLWAQTLTGLYRLEGNTWKSVGSEWGYTLKDGQSLAVDGQGALWSRGTEGTMRLDAGSRAFIETALPGGAGAFFATKDGDLWLADEREGLMRASDSPKTIPATQFGSKFSGIGPSLIDHDGALWTQVDGGQKLLTVRVPNFTAQIRGGGRLTFESTPDEATPCSTGRKIAIVEDREGNIWRAPIGLDRFRSNKFHSVTALFSRPVTPMALSNDRQGVLWALSENALIGFPSGGAAPIDMHFPERNVPVVAVNHEEDGSFLIGIEAAAKIDHLRQRLAHESIADGVEGLGTQMFLRDSAGALWLSTVRGGLYKQEGTAWLRNGGLQGLPPAPPAVLANDKFGRMWAGYIDGTLAKVDRGTVQILGPSDGLALGAITAINDSADDGLWIGGRNGVALYQSKVFHSLKDVGDAPLRNVSGLVQDRVGGLWMNGGSGVAHLTPEQLSRFVRDPDQPMRVERFGDDDGITADAPTLRPLPTALLGGDGRVWFTTAAGLYWIDPNNMSRNDVPPVAVITSIDSGDATYPAGDEVRLPRHSRNMKISFTAPSLTMPQRTRFHYRLEGIDTEWQESQAIRVASYTNVPPGVHHFYLVAENEDGVRSLRTTQMAIVIPPAVYETRWFYVACALGIAYLIWRLAQLRLRHLELRIQERDKERERIARELHDTLIQGALGLMLTFQGLVVRLAKEDPLRMRLENALDAGDHLIRDARDRVSQLRTAQHQGDLTDAIGTAGKEIFSHSGENFAVTCNGKIRPLRAYIAEEMYWIAREALSNVRRHSRAKSVEVEVTYAPDGLRLHVRDDGIGVDSDMIEQGAGGLHLGINGMRERANLIGARFRMFSRPGAGVEIEVMVAASTAYARDSRGWLRPPWSLGKA